MIRKHRAAGGAIAAAAAVAIALTGCSTSTGSSTTPGGPPSVPAATSVGAGEGQLNIIVWAGYAEDGGDDPTVDWVTPFEQQTGCQVNAKVAGTSDEMVQLMQTGQYDGVSASGDATLRLIYGGTVAPVNTSLVSNYATVSDFLKNQAWNSVGGQMYGIPHGWGANVLMYNPAVVTTAPTSWSAVFDQADAYKGKVTAYDSPIYIADAALYLEKTNPSLGITDPYSLTEDQLNAAVDLLKKQNADISEYWSDYTKEVEAFENGTSAIGTSWQVIANLINADGKVKVETTIPSEGATGWSDTWMIASKAAHPNCMYEWMNWIISPKVNAEVAEWFGEAPSQTLSCQQNVGPDVLRHVPRHRRRLCVADPLLDDAADHLLRGRRVQLHGLLRVGRQVAADQGVSSPSLTGAPGSAQPTRGSGPARVHGDFFARHAGARLAALLTPPMLWLVVAYLGSIAVLLITAFWTVNGFTGAVQPGFSLANLQRVVTDPLYRDVTLRTLWVALAVTAIDAVVAFPVAFFMSKVAGPRLRAVLLVAVTTPLWASYLVKAYAWRVMFQPDGPVQLVFGSTPGYGLTATIVTLAYLWLPYMVMPVFAGFDKVPASLVEASADLGAGSWRTVRSIILPLVFPAIAAGSIFTFSLSFGDYIAVTIVGGKTQLLANLIYGQLVTANNQPLAAALSIVPLIAIVLYLLAMRRTGALENV